MDGKLLLVLFVTGDKLMAVSFSPATTTVGIILLPVIKTQALIY
jgi:hypothetical protein